MWALLKVFSTSLIFITVQVTGQNESTTLPPDSIATLLPPAGSVKADVKTETSINTPISTEEVTACDKGRSSRQKLRCHLLEHYDIHVHPVKDSSKAVTVAIGMAIIHLDVNEMKSVMGVDAWMRFDWKDEFLTWDPMDYDNLTQIHLAVGEIWKPDIFVYNSAESTKFDPYGQTHFLVSHTGNVLWVPPAHIKAFCKLDLRYWPLDTQECKLKFGSWTSHGHQIDLALYRNMTQVELLDFYTNNREWVSLATVAQRNRIVYDCCPETYPDVTFEFILQRNSPAYKAVFVLPCLVIMLMTICCFLLPPTAGEKITINGFAFLTCCIFLLYFASSLPFHNNAIPLLVTFYSNTAAMVGIALLLNVTCFSFARDRKYSGPPKFLKNAFSGSLGKCLCLGNYYHQVSSTHERLVLELTDMAESEQAGDRDQETGHHGGEERPILSNDSQNSVMRDWVLVAAGLERFFFVFYTIIFAITTSVYA
ncbi:acetylcholine receptor subunit alpha-type acr-16-like isoform X1 [Tigriopus californicus]|uniref:acetylcholine receptor subunit alpha-type acr-16-like isoform X1 n=1 Tax=Tigriopus californicus TaxID=6832 RepID=UPI0027DA57FF|nr:acetylcholine receptor subunit alpha-type acr-16-like isoform X1 [Tigriopus californicus]